VKFGANILNFGDDATPDALRRAAADAEEEGFDFAMISDHVALTPDVDAQYPAPFYDPLVSLAHLAATTSEIGLGTTVLVMPYRDPLLTARMVASIDQLSAGRFIFGVGAGWSAAEFEALGVDFAQRGEITDEYLTIVRAALTNEVISFQGRFRTFAQVQTGPLPAGGHSIPIWVGGNGRAAMRRAIRLGDAWHPINVEAGWLRDVGLPQLSSLAADLGRQVPGVAPRLALRITASALPERGRRAGSGSLDQIRADLDELTDIGATHVLFDSYASDSRRGAQAVNDRRQTLRLLAREVLRG
jgi:probable F420-dependent oxidoreductase